jgi:hypothetical protein
MLQTYYSQFFITNLNNPTTAGYSYYTKTYFGHNHTYPKLTHTYNNIQISTTTVLHHYNNSRNNPRPSKPESSTPSNLVNNTTPSLWKHNIILHSFNNKHN